jgi:FkbM family methyltransferase
MEIAGYAYFSQNGEDFLLWNLFDFKPNGFYVDIGAFDGIHLSNSYSFEQQGWQGICVEPHPSYYEICKQRRPQSICLNVACVEDDHVDTVEFYKEKLGLLSGIRGGREADVRGRYQRRGLKFSGFKQITVPASTLNALLSKHLPAGTEIDFMSIDTEGTEIDVLRGLDLSKFRPRVLVIEANTEEAKTSLYKHMVELNGYVEARKLVENVFYTRDLKDAKMIRRLSIDCRVMKSLHPLGDKYTLPEHLEGRVIQESKAIRRMLPDISRQILGKLKGLLAK